MGSLSSFEGYMVACMGNCNSTLAINIYHLSVVMVIEKFTVLNLIQCMEKNNFNFENERFSGKGRQSLHI